MRSEPAECPCPREFPSGTITSERFTASHAPTTPCMCVLGSSWAPLHQTGACAGRQQEAGMGSTGKSGFLCLTGHLKMSDGDLCQHTVLLCSWQPKGRWDESKAEEPRQTQQKSAVGNEIRTPQRVLTAPVGTRCPTKPMQMPDKDQQLHSKVQLGKAKGTGSILHGTEEAAVQSDRLWELAQFVIHSVRCYPKQKNEKSVWRAMFWFRAMQAWGTFPLIFQNS